MAMLVYRIDMPPTGIEVTGEGSNPTDDQMREEEKARQDFLDRVGPKLAALPALPPHRSGNIVRVELFGVKVWSEMNHYLLMVTTDIGQPHDFDLASLVPPGCETSELIAGEYGPINSWPEDASA
jgi:hypothetical protein